MITRQLLTGMGAHWRRADRFLHDFQRDLPEHGISTRLRVAHFLAQIFHESGRLRYTREVWGPTAAQLRYEGRRDLGNTEPGDGKRFLGRGLIQLTGRTNYQRFSDWLDDGGQVVRDPSIVAIQHAVRSAVYFWTRENLNQLADLDDCRAITRKINGGYNGLADRLALLERAKRLIPPDEFSPDENTYTHRVTASRLNVRSEPLIKDGNIVAVIERGTGVWAATRVSQGEWTRIHSDPGCGYVATRYLEGVS